MTPPPQDDTHTKRYSSGLDSYYIPLAERVTILEQKHKMQTDHFKEEIATRDRALKEQLKQLKDTQVSLQLTAARLELAVNELKVRSGIVATIASVVTVVAFFFLEMARRKISGE